MLLRAGRYVPGPAFDLEDFQTQVAAGNFHVYKGRAVSLIRTLFGCGRARATAYAKQVALSLPPGDYAHTLRMPDGQEHDVYGKLVGLEGWYVKIEIHIHDGQPGIVSCHPAEHDLVTLNGIVPGVKKRS